VDWEVDLVLWFFGVGWVFQETFVFSGRCCDSLIPVVRDEDEGGGENCEQKC